MQLLAVFIGGALGAVARFAVSTAMQARLGSTFPWGTLAVNTAGSLLLGLLLPFTGSGAPVVHLFAVAGCAGALTTFSTFAYDAVALVHNGRARYAAAYVAASVVLGVAAVAAGLGVARLAG